MVITIYNRLLGSKDATFTDRVASTTVVWYLSNVSLEIIFLVIRFSQVEQL